MNNPKTTTYLSTALIIAGFLLIALAWNGAASQFLVDKQIPFLVSGGLTGIGFIVCGCTLAGVQELRKAATRIEVATQRMQAAALDEEEGDVFADTLPEPRTPAGSTIVRDEAAGATS